MAPRLLPCLGLAGLGSLDLCPQHLRLWQGGPSRSLLRLGLSWWLGLGTRSASQVGGALASLPTPSCFLSAVDMWGERPPDLSEPGCSQGPSLQGLWEELGSGVRLLVSSTC